MERVMEESGSLEINVGSVGSLCGNLKFSVVVESNGKLYVQIWCHDPSDARRSGVLARLEPAKFDNLKQIISQTDATITKVRQSPGGPRRSSVVGDQFFLPAD
jgi:hypothetical protein